MSYQYQLNYRIKRRQKAINYLGDHCAKCEETDSLEFDHINPDTKVKEISQAIIAGWSWDKLVVELDKCQLLCKNHHVEKTATEFKVPCGNYWSYRKYGCRCEACVEANSKQIKQWKSSRSSSVRQ